MALAGMLSALSVTVMTLGSLIPVNTYLCPVICMMLGREVLARCGRRLSLCWYLATAILGLLLSPDREAALVFALLGYYPLVKPRFDRLGIPAKLLFFTAAGALSFVLAAWVLGIPLEAPWLLGLTLVLWDGLFLLVDRLLGLPLRKR